MINFLETTIYRIILKTYLLLEATGRQNSFERFPYLRVLTERLTEECLETWQHDTGTEASRYCNLLNRICESDTDPDYSILCNALDLCLAVAHVPEFAAYLNYYTGNAATIQLASELDGVTHSGYDAILRRLQKLQKVCFVDWNKNPLPYAAVEMDNVLLSYLTGADNLYPRLFADRIECFDHGAPLQPMFIRAELAAEGARWLSRTNQFQSDSFRINLLQIQGQGGRRFLARHVAKLMNKDLILIDVQKCKDLLEANADEHHFWNQLVHAAFLKNALVCLHGIAASLFSVAQIDAQDLISTAVTPFADTGIPVILCTDAAVRFAADRRFYMHQISLGELTRKEREAVFHGFSTLCQLPIDCPLCSVRYPLTASEIADAAARCTDKADSALFMDLCSTILYQKSEKILGQILYPSVGFVDLVLPDSAKNTLEQVCCAVTEGYQLFETWNLRHQYPYGRAVTVLLYGPPGTGKTMTAHAIAKELGTALYHVDLSHVLDKYIGETEKHLEQIFAFAQKARPVLFFDEADSLFGKRGEITDGKDRYANMEVSYILQRIEQFDGIVVLATNLYASIDKAFLRRMKYVLKFQLPDAAMRRHIWENCLPPELPRENLDLDYLAAQFDFTGGIIKNVVFTACVMAFLDRKKLCMEHVLNAVRAEYEKLERPVDREMWGKYGDLIG